MDNIKRGELYYADLSPVVGSEQGGVRPVLIVQNDIGNKYSPTVIVAAITSQINKAKIPTHIELGVTYGLTKDSVLLLEQIRTLDKRRLREKIGILDEKCMKDVNQALLISLGFWRYLHLQILWVYFYLFIVNVIFIKSNIFFIFGYWHFVTIKYNINNKNYVFLVVEEKWKLNTNCN